MEKLAAEVWDQRIAICGEGASGATYLFKNFAHKSNDQHNFKGHTDRPWENHFQHPCCHFLFVQKQDLPKLRSKPIQTAVPPPRAPPVRRAPPPPVLSSPRSNRSMVPPPSNYGSNNNTQRAVQRPAPKASLRPSIGGGDVIVSSSSTAEHQHRPFPARPTPSTIPASSSKNNTPALQRPSQAVIAKEEEEIAELEEQFRYLAAFTELRKSIKNGADERQTVLHFARDYPMWEKFLTQSHQKELVEKYVDGQGREKRYNGGRRTTG